MLFEKNNRVFNAYPLTKYHYNLKVSESCFAVRFVFDDGDEYVVKKYDTLEKAKAKCEQFNHRYKVNTHPIKVTRVSYDKYTYETCTRRSHSKHGTRDGIFTQVPASKVDDFTIRGRTHHYDYYKDKAQPDDFTIGASYLAEECIKPNAVMDDEFAIGASYASSDFYEYHMRNSHTT